LKSLPLRAVLFLAVGLVEMHAHSFARAEEPASTAAPSFMAIAGATSDYVYRGVSLRNERPTPLLFVAATFGNFYVNGFLIGTELGNDALGRGIGTIEADGTAGVTYTIGQLDLNTGARYTFYPNGRDLIINTLIEAERDIFEPFADATFRFTEQISAGTTVYWTPNFYYETGEVFTVEGHASYVLPTVAGIESKLTGVLGYAKSENPNVISPGDGYMYWNVGIEGVLERLTFDLRYWDTDVSNVDGYDQRFVVSVGVILQ
jgi:hypothetical protein